MVAGYSRWLRAREARYRPDAVELFCCQPRHIGWGVLRCSLALSARVGIAERRCHLGTAGQG
jgi:hypothetical protein